MKLAIAIRLDSAAFDPDPAPEVARILRELADRIADSGSVKHLPLLRDVNGNSVGRVVLTRQGTSHE